MPDRPDSRAVSFLLFVGLWWVALIVLRDAVELWKGEY